MLPDSNPVMESKVLLMQLRGIKDVHFHFCLGSKKTPWTRARRWVCFLMLFLVMGTSALIFYNSSPQVSWPLNVWTIKLLPNQSHNNVTPSVSIVSMFAGFCVSVVLKERKLLYQNERGKRKGDNASVL